MDVTLQRHCARYIYIVPDGLRELMSDISREVLRSQPEDIYTFIADYLDALLITRENARISAKFVQQMTEGAETVVDLLQRSGMSRSEADRAAEIIQEAFRTWSSRKGILKEDEDLIVTRIIEEAGISELQAQEAAVCIQHAFRAFKIRQQKEQELLDGTVDWRIAARSAIRLYRKTGVSNEEAKKAANTIKAAYKGYYTRRTMKMLNEVNVAIPDEEEGGEENEETISLVSGDTKKKEVRLDFASMVPHVDFGGEELISKDLDNLIDTGIDIIEEDEDFMAKIFGGPKKVETDSTSTSFIKELLEECVMNVDRIDKVKKPSIAPIEEEDMSMFEELNVKETDEKEDEDDLQQELMRAKLEMEELKELKHADASITEENEAPPAPPEEVEPRSELIKEEEAPSMTVQEEEPPSAPAVEEEAPPPEKAETPSPLPPEETPSPLPPEETPAPPSPEETPQPPPEETPQPPPKETPQPPPEEAPQPPEEEEATKQEGKQGETETSSQAGAPDTLTETSILV